jgi:hypothetical protein
VGALVLLLVVACTDLGGLSGPASAGALSDGGTDDASGTAAKDGAGGTPGADAAETDANAAPDVDAAPEADAAACAPVQLDELLASTLRGIKIASFYYAISERRNAVSGARAIVIGHCPTAPDSNFDTCQSYVLSTIDADFVSPTSRVVDAHDALGHRLELNMSYDVANNCWNTFTARMNGSAAMVTMQTYAGVMNVCGLALEPLLAASTCPP